MVSALLLPLPLWADLCRNTCSHMLDDLQHMHPWTPSIQLHRKKSLAAFYTHTSFLLQCLFTELCEHQQLYVVEGLCQPIEGSGLTERSPVKCASSERSKRSTNLPSQPRENPGTTQGWYWAGTPSLREYWGIEPCEPWSVVHWGSLLTLLIWVIMWTLQDLPLCSTQVQTTDIKKVIFSEKYFEASSLLWKTTHYFKQFLCRCLCLFEYQAQLMFWSQINICPAFNSLTLTVPFSYLQHNVVWNHPCELEILTVTLVALSNTAGSYLTPSDTSNGQNHDVLVFI